MPNATRRFKVELGLAGLSSQLLVLTLAWRDWIEIVFRIDPDHGNGSLEWGHRGPHRPRSRGVRCSRSRRVEANALRDRPVTEVTVYAQRGVRTTITAARSRASLNEAPCDILKLDHQTTRIELGVALAGRGSCDASGEVVARDRRDSG